MALFKITSKQLLSKAFTEQMGSTLVRLTSVRHMSSEKDKKKKACEVKFDPNKPPCQKDEACRKVQREINCYAIMKNKPKCLKKKYVTFKPAPNEKTAWETSPPFDVCWEEFPKFPEECCPLCPYEVHLDMYHYKVRNINREFPQTWIECPNQFVEVERCKSEEYDMKYDYRPRECRPSKELAQACHSSNDKCPKISLAPCCRKGRSPPSCFVSKPLSDCVKACVPVPSYSECCAKEPYDMPGRSAHCRCLDIPNMCYINRELNKRNKS